MSRPGRKAACLLIWLDSYMSSHSLLSPKLQRSACTVQYRTANVKMEPGSGRFDSNQLCWYFHGHADGIETSENSVCDRLKQSHIASQYGKPMATYGIIAVARVSVSHFN